MDGISKSKILAVEGNDEINFFSALLNELDIEDVQIYDFEGKYNFRKKLQTLTLSPNFDIVRSVGLVRDADQNHPHSAFQSLCDTINSLDYTAPENISIFSGGNPRFGIFIMPDNEGYGMLEDLCLSSLEENEVMECINNFYECIPDKPENFKTAKSKTLAYLSTCHPSVNSLGLAARKGYFDFNHACFTRIKEFLRNL